MTWIIPFVSLAILVSPASSAAQRSKSAGNTPPAAASSSAHTSKPATQQPPPAAASDDISMSGDDIVASKPPVTLTMLRDNSRALAAQSRSQSIYHVRIDDITLSTGISPTHYYLFVRDPKTGVRTEGASRRNFVFFMSHRDRLEKAVMEKYKKYKNLDARIDFDFNVDYKGPLAWVKAIYWYDESGNLVDWADDELE